MIDKLFIPVCLLASIMVIPTDIIFNILRSFEERSDLKIFHIIIICYTIYSIYNGIEESIIGPYTQSEYINAEEYIGDIILNTLFICMMFGNTINIFYIPLMLLILLIKLNTKALNERVKINYIPINKKMMIFNIFILNIIIYYFIKYQNYMKGIPCYIIYECLSILTNYITIGYYLYIIKEREESEYLNIYFHLQSIVVVIFNLLIKLEFLIVTSYLKRVPFNIFRGFWSEVHNLKKKFKGFIAYLKIEKLLNNSESIYDVECPICTEIILQGKKLKCGHSFHINCLKLWVLQQQLCPVCRINLFESQQQPFNINEDSDSDSNVDNEPLSLFQAILNEVD